ncbi:MAG: DUF1624 domain-containing protein [Clostridiales bacterium]|nr:DUF1624 domain-containing protein [Clostridiales bacterium]
MSENTRSLGTESRIHFMDELRGFAVVLMVAYHGFYTVGYLFDRFWGRFLFGFFTPAEPFFAGLFIFICGISSRLSRSNIKRGLLLLGVAVTVSAVLWVFRPEDLILFGILHFLSVSILLFGLVRRGLDRIPPLTGLIICGLLLLITWWVPDYKGSLLGIKGLAAWSIPKAWKQPWLFWLGLGEVQTADYFPVLPWIFCFLGGSFAGVWAAKGRFPRWMYRKRVPFLSSVGRHSLLIYILHQPAIYAVCYLILIIGRAIAG